MLKVKGFVFSPVQENTYVVYNGEKLCCVIDPGCYFSSERKELQNFIEGEGLTLKYLLNTHCHLDHVFGNKFIFDTYHTPLHIHKEEARVLAYAPTSGERWNLPFDNYDGELVYLAEGDVVKLGNDELKVLFTPGHSPGHISFYSEADRLVLSGDVLFRQSIGRTDLPGGDFETLERSIIEKLYRLPDDVTVYCGHGERTTIGHEKKHNPYVAIN
jgi:hydroxyacylglutathione hydrolase